MESELKISLSERQMISAGDMYEKYPRHADQVRQLYNRGVPPLEIAELCAERGELQSTMNFLLVTEISACERREILTRANEISARVQEGKGFTGSAETSRRRATELRGVGLEQRGK